MNDTISRLGTVKDTYCMLKQINTPLKRQIKTSTTKKVKKTTEDSE